MKKKVIIGAIVMSAAIGVLCACSGGGKAADSTAAAPGTESAAESTTESTAEAAEPSEEIEQQIPEEEKEQTLAPELYPAIIKEYRSVSSEDGSVLLVSGRYPRIVLKNTGYENLAAALNSWNDQVKTRGEQSINEIAEMAQEFLEYNASVTDGEEEPFWPYTRETDAAIMRADADVFSIRCNLSSYTGGAHGDYGVSCYNFDSSTGEELLLEDIISDRNALYTKLLQTLGEKYGADTFFDGYEQVVEDEVFENQEEGHTWMLTWSLDSDGITVYFDHYEIAPYAAGQLTAKIPYKGNEAMFARQDIFEGGDSVIPVRLYDSIYLDTDGDGTEEELYLSESYMDESEFNRQLQIRLNDAEITAGADFGVSAAYLMKREGGQIQLYVETMSYNDYRILSVFDLSQKVPAYEGYFYGGSFYENVPANPDNFLLSARLELLSTYYGDRPYRSAETGMPEALQDAYTLDGPEVTAKREVPAFTGEHMDEPCVIPSGCAVTFVSTDGETWVEMKDAEGTVYRVYVNREWPQTIDGTEIEEYFDGLIFAG